MLVHKILRGAGAERYLPFAQSRLRFLAKMHGPKQYFTQKYRVEDATIEVRQEPPGQYIFINGGAPRLRYEFFTSDHVAGGSFGSPGFQTVGNRFVAGSMVSTTFDKYITKALPKPKWSSALPFPYPEGAWVVRPVDSLVGAGQPGNPITWPAWQNQKFNEHVWHPNNDGKSLVTSTQAQFPGLNHQANWGSPYNNMRIANTGSRVVDHGFDVMPAYYNSSSTIQAAPQMDHDYTWWRHAAVATSDTGKKFFVCTDNYGRFQVYRVKRYEDTNDVVEVGRYKMLTPPYPGWVTVPDPTDGRYYDNHWTWRFNKDATKCVSCPYHSDVTGFMAYNHAQRRIGSILPEHAGLFDPQSAIFPAQEDTVGLVEFGIQIVETGEEELDFEVTFTVLRSSYFGDTNRWFMDAAYFLPDVENIGIPEDTLMTLEMECRVPAGRYLANNTVTAGFDDYYYLDAFSGLKAEVVINANDAAMVRTEKLRFVTNYPTKGQFPTVATHRTFGTVVGVPVFAGITMSLPLLAGGSYDYPWAGPCSYTPAGPTQPASGFTLGYLQACELSTMSVIYQVDDHIGGFSRFRAISHGITLDSRDNPYAPEQIGPEPAEAATVLVPSARIHQAQVDVMLATEIGQGFSVHPAGHFSCSVNAYLGWQYWLADDLDWVSVKGKDAEGLDIRTRFTHKALYNQAYGQTRDYTFYTEPFEGLGNFDYGSFRTQGIWLTFR